MIYHTMFDLRVTKVGCFAFCAPLVLAEILPCAFRSSSWYSCESIDLSAENGFWEVAALAFSWSLVGAMLLAWWITVLLGAVEVLGVTTEESPPLRLLLVRLRVFLASAAAITSSLRCWAVSRRILRWTDFWRRPFWTSACCMDS